VAPVGVHLRMTRGQFLTTRFAPQG
jgi:hypothetical protein